MMQCIALRLFTRACAKQPRPQRSSLVPLIALLQPCMVRRRLNAAQPTGAVVITSQEKANHFLWCLLLGVVGDRMVRPVILKMLPVLPLVDVNSITQDDDAVICARTLPQRQQGPLPCQPVVR